MGDAKVALTAVLLERGRAGELEYMMVEAKVVKSVGIMVAQLVAESVD